MVQSKSLVQLKIPMSNYKDLTRIGNKKQYRDAKGAKPKQVVAVDTETHNGNIFHLADSTGKFLGHPNISFENIAEHLLSYEDDLIFFYNLGYDAGCIMKLLPKDILNKYKTNNILHFTYNKYHIHYIPKRLLSIRKGNHVALCYDIAQYFDNQSLPDAYKKHIGELTKKYLDFKGQRKKFTLRYYLRNKKQIHNYCVQDCIYTKELANYWLNIFKMAYGFLPRKWISSGYLAEKVVLYFGIMIPYFKDIPYEYHFLAWQCFYGGRFELIMRGFIGECYQYDVNSAYPYALTKIPDIRDGKWIKSVKINPNSALGFFHIRASVSDSVKISPFPFRTKKNRIIYPVGGFETFVTLEELNAVVGDSRISYKIIDSLQFIPNKNCTYPFRNFIEEQYAKRLKLKHDKNPIELAIKIILNSIYGKTAQRVNNETGNLFFPIIASFITGYARAQLYKFVRDNNLEKETVAFATDSVACTRKIPNLNSEKLGEMKLDKEGNDVFFLSNGFYKFNGKWKNRGIGYDTERKLEIEHTDTKVDKKGQLYITVKTTKTTHIRSGIKYNKIDKVGKIEVYEKHINLNSDRKRFWEKDLTALDNKTRCDSVPININLFDDNTLDKLAETDYEYEYHPESEL